MAASFDGLRERWERMTPSEQRLITILGVTIVVCIIAAMVARIQSGMTDLEKKNAEARQALRALAVYRNAKARSEGTGDEIKIPEKPLALDSYLETIVSELELTSPTYPALKESTSGNHVELSFQIQMKGLDIAQLTTLLEKVESQSKLVVIKELTVDRNFRDKEKLDLDMTVATYKKVSAKKEENEESEGSEDGEGEDS